ncbi:MAG: TIGR02710 family CRISPR-associated protein [Desulfovibrio sp.]|nr:TIGR02710 family CRISPR-associated protein [Desulfovibrio sp.]
MNTPVVMVCTVGGAPAPLRTSIVFHKPTHVIYVASPQSLLTIHKDIESGLEWVIGVTQSITLTNFQDIVQCVRDMRKGIANALQAMSLPEDTPLIADITGGTKVMSAALALVMMEFPSRFSYVGGTTRTKDGLGIVESGTEIVIQDANPWDVLALREVQTLAYSFNRAQFADALAAARRLAEHMDDERWQKFYAAIADMVQGYMLWDSFDHKGALAKLKQADGRLNPYTLGSQLLCELLANLRQDAQILERLQKDVQALNSKNATLTEDTGRAYLLDLLGNARRRAAAGHYDDAVARLYSALEKCAKTTLRLRHGLDNSAMTLEQVPESLRETLRPLADAQGLLRIGLQKTFLLLASLGDPLGADYLTHSKELEQALEARNQSLLAHGYLPIDKAKYEKLFKMTLEFLHAKEDDLPAFPTLEWKALLP